MMLFRKNCAFLFFVGDSELFKASKFNEREIKTSSEEEEEMI